MPCSSIKDIDITAEVFLILQSISFFSIHTVLPQFLLHQSCLNAGHGEICNNLGSFPDIQKQVQEDAALWVSISYIGRYLPSIFTVLIWGALIDRIGHRSLMLLPPAVTFVQAILLVACSCFPACTPLYPVIIASISALYGDFSGYTVLAYSYGAVISQHDKGRTTRLGILVGTMMLANTAGSMIAGNILQRSSYTVTFGFVVLLSLIHIHYLLCCAKPAQCPEEDVPRDRIMAKDLNPIKNLVKSVVVITRSPYRVNLAFILAIMFFLFASMHGMKLMTVLFITNSPFNFSPKMVGYYTAYTAFVSGAGTIVFVHVVRKLFNGDFVPLYVGISSSALMLILVGASRTVVMLFLVRLLSATSFLPFPILFGQIAKYVGGRDVAKALSVNETLATFCSLVTSVVGTNIYRFTLDFNTGFCFYIFAGFSLAALLVVIVMHVLLRCGVIVVPHEYSEIPGADG